MTSIIYAHITSHLLYSSINGHLGCFHILVILNNDAVDLFQLVFFGYFGKIQLTLEQQRS